MLALRDSANDVGVALIDFEDSLGMSRASLEFRGTITDALHEYVRGLSTAELRRIRGRRGRKRELAQ